LCAFGTFFPVLVSCTKKNLATLQRSCAFADSVAEEKKIPPKFFFRPDVSRFSGFSSSPPTFVCQTVFPIEILGAMLEEASLKKGRIFLLISTLFCEVKRGFVDR
jgi:hypothetical protein